MSEIPDLVENENLEKQGVEIHFYICHRSDRNTYREELE